MTEKVDTAAETVNTPDLAVESTTYGPALTDLSEAAHAAAGPETLEAAYALREKAQTAVHIANRMMCAHDRNSRVRGAAQAALDALMIDLYRAKWRLGRHDGTYVDFVEPDPDAGLGPVLDGLAGVIKRAVEIARACQSSAVVSTPPPPRLESRGTEIQFAGDVPLVPSICPVVVLAGSNRDMGRQYATQIIDIFGSWIFERLAAREVTAEDRLELDRWRAHLKVATPEILQFAEGWSEGARDRGVPLSVDHTVAIWTGYGPPATRHLSFGEDLDAPQTSGLGMRSYLGGLAGGLAAAGDFPDRCSGVAAWGEATTGGRLVAGATTDHECTWQATIVAYPEEGNRFIYTPFSVNGSTPVLGRQFMAGHPGFNDKGVAYVEHGGAGFGGPSCGGGPLDEWGYGVRRGASTFHALQFANSADEARDMQLALPVGDPGHILGTAGGFFADAGYGVVIEERAGSPDRPTPILREESFDADGRAYQFLTATNTALSCDIGAWKAPLTGNYQYSLEGGWHILSVDDANTADPAVQAARMATKNSAARNRQLYRSMMARYGDIDVEHMKATYRQSGSMPEGPYEDVVARWRAGEEWDASAAHRGNAFTALIEPDPAEAGSYHACIGPAARSLQVREPSHGYYYYDETNTFWTLRLAETPTRMMELAEDEAATRIRQAERLLADLPVDHAARHGQVSLLQQAEEALTQGRARAVAEDGSQLTDRAVGDVAFRTRAFTRAQVRASQIIEAHAG